MAVAGAEASEAAGAGLLELVLSFFGGGSMKPSSLQVCKLDKMELNTDEIYQDQTLE